MISDLCPERGGGGGGSIGTVVNQKDGTSC